MDIYEELGLRPFINAYRPLTRLGGATIPSQVLDAMREASLKSIDLKAMHVKTGRAIAELTRNEAAYVSCGAASGITLAIAACMAGTDPELSSRLPNTDGMRNEVIVQACDLGWSKADVAIRSSGARIVKVETAGTDTENLLGRAIGEKTAAIFTHDNQAPGKLPMSYTMAVAREHGIPLLVDAAFSVPPKESLWKYTRDLGADAVFISGGKGLRGPQSTGLILGKGWLVNACAFHGVPNDRIGRGMKVGKEELAGMYAAVKLFMAQDEGLSYQLRREQIEYIVACISTIPDVTLRQSSRTRATIVFEKAIFGLTSTSASAWLLNAVPSVYVEPSRVENAVIVSSECLEPGEETIVANQLKELLTTARNRNQLEL
jgi:L-seryl-tRNA(Ser) seleniumtransferase